MKWVKVGNFAGLLKIIISLPATEFYKNKITNQISEEFVARSNGMHTEDSKVVD